MEVRFLRVRGDWSNFELVVPIISSCISKAAYVKHTDHRGSKLEKLLLSLKPFGFGSAGFVFRELQNK